MSPSIERIPKFETLSCDIVECRSVLMSFSVEKLLSAHELKQQSLGL